MAEATSSNCQWLVSDVLGTPRMLADQTGLLAGIKRRDYLPFGEELLASVGHRTTANGYATAQATQPRQQFTGKERDNETGLDYFEARYYGAVYGRFTSPDEFTGGPDELFDFAEDAADNPTFYADLLEPASLNKYVYCYNNPLNYIDPDGHDGVKEWLTNTLNGAASAFAEDNGLKGLDAPQTKTGRAIGHGVALVQSAVEIVGGAAAIIVGGGEAIVTSPAAATGVGAVVPAAGVAAAAVGTAGVLHGSAVAGNTLGNIFRKGSGKPVHHIATNKNYTSTTSGGPWTPKFEPLFEKAGIKMNHPENLVAVKGHKGPHPKAYHEEVYRRLLNATKGLRGGTSKYKTAFLDELRAIKSEVSTPGTFLNRLVRTPGS